MDRLLRNRVVAWLFAAGVLVVAVLGNIGDAFQTTSGLLSTWYGVLIFLSLLAVILLWHSHHRRTPQLPDADEVFDDSAARKLWIGTNCTDAYVRQANALAKRVFGKDSLPRAVIESWRQQNKQILVCVHEPSNRVVGYFDILPLKEPFRQEFLSGKKRERDIRGADLYKADSMQRCTVLYLAGLAVCCHGKICESAYAERVVTLILAACDYAQHCYPVPPDRTIYALAATGKGRTMLERFGFGIAMPGRERIDKTDLYALHLTAESIQAMRLAIEPFRERYPVRWKSPPSAFPAALVQS